MYLSCGELALFVASCWLDRLSFALAPIRLSPDYTVGGLWESGCIFRVSLVFASSTCIIRFTYGCFPEIPIGLAKSLEIYAALNEMVVRVEVNAARILEPDGERHLYDVISVRTQDN